MGNHGNRSYWDPGRSMIVEGCLRFSVVLAMEAVEALMVEVAAE